MDKVIEHKNIARRIVEEVYRMAPSSENMETLIIIDDERGHYLLFSDGWQNNRRSYNCFLHLEVKPNGKIYLRHDGTNLEIANELLCKGISKDEIVLAFHAPYRRSLTGFAQV